MAPEPEKKGKFVMLKPAAVVCGAEHSSMSMGTESDMITDLITLTL